MERCVPGIVFLSGGLSEEAASVYLNLMNGIDRKACWNVALLLWPCSSTLLPEGME